MKANFRKVIFMTLIAGYTYLNAFSQNDNFKALFIYNFTKYIEWPAMAQSSEFVIAVLGKGAVVDELQKIALKFKVNGKPISIQQVNFSGVIQSAQIIFVLEDKTSDLGQLTELSKSKHVLLIAEKPNACSLGAGLNFVAKGGNLSFEIHKGNIEKAGLIVSSGLMLLGINVE